MAQAGRVLNADEVREYQAYGNAGLSQPDKFANVVQDHTDIRGMVYRYATDEEMKSADASAKAQAEAAKSDAELDRKVRAEAAKRGQQVTVPDRPADVPTAPAVQRS